LGEFRRVLAGTGREQKFLADRFSGGQILFLAPPPVRGKV